MQTSKGFIHWFIYSFIHSFHTEIRDWYGCLSLSWENQASPLFLLPHPHGHKMAAVPLESLPSRQEEGRGAKRTKPLPFKTLLSFSGKSLQRLLARTLYLHLGTCIYKGGRECECSDFGFLW